MSNKNDFRGYDEYFKKEFITKEKFLRFIEFRNSAAFNVFDPKFRDSTNLSKEEVIFIIKNFDELEEDFKV